MIRVYSEDFRIVVLEDFDICGFSNLFGEIRLIVFLGRDWKEKGWERI